MTCCVFTWEEEKPPTKEEEEEKNKKQRHDTIVVVITMCTFLCMLLMCTLAMAIKEKQCTDAGYVLAKDEYNHGARLSKLEIAQAYAVAGMKRQDPVYRRRAERGIHTDCDYDCHLDELMEVFKEYRKMTEDLKEEDW
jgi:hypothetical protein